MGQNVFAVLSEAYVKSRKAGKLKGNVMCNQQTKCPSCSSNISYYHASLRQIKATLRSKGMAMAQMPTRAPTHNDA